MKVCFFMNTPFTLGGEQRVTTEIANYLCEKNIDVTFLLLDKSMIVDRNKYKLNEKVKVIFVKKYSKKFLIILRQISKLINNINYKTNIFSGKLNILKKIYLNNIEKKILVNEIKQYDFDCIIGVGLRYTVILSLLKDELKNIRIIGWQHSTYEAYFETCNSRMYNSRNLANFMFKNLDEYIVQTDDDKEKIKKKFEFNATVINNPNSKLKNEKINQKKENIFLSTGRFVKLKNYDKIICAFNNFFYNYNKNWKLFLVGDGPERKKCEKLVAKFGIKENVVFTGNVRNVEDYYSKSKIYICASEYEGWGMSITEAMMFNNIVISYNFPSVKEIFGDEDCGIILKENTIDEMTKAMNTVTEGNDSKKIKAKSKNAINQVKKFDINIIGKKWLIFLYGGK